MMNPRENENPFQINVRDQGAEACVRIAPGRSSLTADQLHLLLAESLRRASVTHGVIEEACDAAVACAVEGRPSPEPLVLARGTPVAHGDNGGVAREGDWSKPFLPGMVVGHPRHATAGKAGTTVQGRAVLARVGGGKPCLAGHGVKARQDGAFVAAHYGVAAEEAGHVVVHPLLRVAPDGMSATAEIHPFLADGSALAPEHLLSALHAHGVRVGAAEGEIAKVCAEVRAAGTPRADVVVAQGSPARPGRNAEPEWLCRPGEWFRPGAVVARKLPPQPGEHGTKVTGERVPVAAVRDLPLPKAKGFTLSRDGASLSSPALGVLRLTGGVPELEGHFRIDPQKRNAWMDLPARDGHGQEVTLADVVASLRHWGVVAGAQEEAIRAALVEASRAGGVKERVLVARAVAPTPPRDGRLETRVPTSDEKDPRWAALVEKGARVGLHLAPEAGAAGVLLDGTPVAPPATKPVACEVGPGLGVEGNAVTAACTGFLLRSGVRWWMEPLVEISPEGMTAWLTLFPPPPGAPKVTPASVQSALTAEGVVFGVDASALSEAFRELDRTAGPVRRRVIASGQPPTDGTDGRLELLLDMSVKAGEVDEHGRMDFRRRGSIHNVKQGQTIARWTPATPGAPGRTIRGAVVSASSGKQEPLRAGAGVTVREDGRLFLAEIDGLVHLEATEVRVDQSVVVEKDVDFSSGAIDSEGSVHVRGTVRSTFPVRSKASVLVEGSVEKTQVVAEGTIEVHGGVFGGQVTAGKGVRCAVIEHGTIRSVGDVEVLKSCMNSDVRACGEVRMVTGKGVVIGGRLYAAGRIEVNTIGSEAEVPTVVWAGYDYREMDTIEERLALLRKEEERLTGHGEARGRRLHAAPEPAGVDLLAIREAITRVHAMWTETLARTLAARDLSIVVHSMLHPHAVIRVGAGVFEAKAAVKGPVAFRFDPSTGGLTRTTPTLGRR